LGAAGKIDVEFIPDLVFAEPGGRPLLLDLYLPRPVARPVPLIVWLHGGGWRFGDRRVAPDLRRYFAERGYAMASVDYRYAGEAIFPAQIHDVKNAVRWLRHNAQRYAIDGTRIGLWGSSAGGHLAALAGVTGTGTLEPGETPWPDTPTGVQAVVDGYGPIDFSQLDAHRIDVRGEPDDPEGVHPQGDMTSARPDSFESEFVGGPIADRAALVAAANPVTYVAPGAPPFLIMHGLSDLLIPAHQSILLYEALAAAGDDVTLCLIKGWGHGFFLKDRLQKGPAGPVEIRHARNGGREPVSGAPAITFDFIESFFRRQLGAPG
jgi:acetyl esterase/lipase